MNINLLAFSIIFAFSIQCSCQNPDSVVISTNYGKLRGFVHILADSKQKIDIFFGIPFAHPPLGNLRFEKPLPPASWKEVRDASEESKPSACVPHGRPIGGWTSSKFSEDCLYLNIFAPHHKINENIADALPILLLIHGGAYEIGSSARYSDYEKMGSRFVAKGVILVSIQYRLGVYGFASTGNNEMPGNLGIWDQIAALRWIKENIGAFGGDPLRVTVLGYSAGSGSTGLLSTTPAAKDLFHQTVRMSGSVLGNSGSGTFVPKNTMELAQAMNCSAANSSLKKCFKQKSVEEFFEGIEQIGAAPISYAIAKFSPYRMDKELFEIDHPEAIAKSPPKRTMLGFTELDFLLMTLIMDRNSSVSMLALTDEDVQNYGQPHFEAFLRNFVAKNEYFGEQIGQQIRAELFDFYVNKYEHKEEKNRDAEFFLRLYSMVCSDLMMVVPLLWESQMRIAANWPMYLYEFKYINPEVFPKRVKVHVAYHDYDHDLIFSEELTKNEDDKRIAAFLIESIVNFVKSGDPSSEAIEWKTTGNFSLTDSESISHMEIGIKPKQKEGMKGEIRRMHFWMQIRQKYGDKFDLVRGIYGNTATTSINAAGLFWPIVAIIISLTIMHFGG